MLLTLASARATYFYVGTGALQVEEDTDGEHPDGGANGGHDEQRPTAYAVQ